MQGSSQQFNPFAPGFDFLKRLTEGSAAPSSGAFPGWNDWVAPTMNVQELEKRISELKTVLFWLEQNQRALAATIQAMEVQKMTLSTLQTMNVPVENWAATMVQSWQNLAQGGMNGATGAGRAGSSASGGAAPAAEAAPASPAREVAPEQAEAAQDAGSSPKSGSSSAVVADPVQWWGALTQQFQQIANQAVTDVAQQAMQHAETTRQAAESAAKAMHVGVGKAASSKGAAPAARSAGSKAPAAKRSSAAKKPAPSKKPTASRAR